MSTNDILISLKSILELKKEHDKDMERFKQSFNNISQLAKDGVRNFELNDEITIDGLLTDKYVTEDKTLILSNLLSDLSCAIEYLNLKMTQLSEKVEQIETHMDAFESYVNGDIEDKIRKNKELITATADNLTTVREKYIKDERDK